MKNLKLGYYQDIKNKEILDMVNDGQGHDVLLSTNACHLAQKERGLRATLGDMAEGRPFFTVNPGEVPEVQAD